MKKTSIKFIYKTLLLSCLITVCSCRKMFDQQPKDQVDVANAYQNVYDANAAVIGIYGKLLTVADKYIVLNELRADLMKPTANADKNLRDLNDHNAQIGNPWIDPRPWYVIILNCNDAMAHFDTMVKEGKITDSDYQQRYSDVGAIRCWVYLQLGIQFGSIPYVTDALSNVEDLKDETKYPKIGFDDLLTNLIAFMGDSKRFLDPYLGNPPTAATSLVGATVDSYTTNLFFIDKHQLLGDLYLWNGDYNLASTQFAYLANWGSRQGNGTLVPQAYKATNGAGFGDIRYGNSNNASTLVDNNTDGWRGIFGRPTQDTYANSEWVWSIPFDKSFAPGDPFINLFSNQGGSYLLTTSQNMINKWNAQTEANGFPYDARKVISVKTINGQPVIMKPLYLYLTGPNLTPPPNPLQKTGRWLIYRGATVLNHFAEAANRDNQTRLAYGLINVGIKTVFNTVWPATSGSIPVDVTNIETPSTTPPYNLDARQGETPYFRGPWYLQVGTRSRAYLAALPSTLATNNNVEDMEDAIIEEDALEMAFEGNRWQDLVRIARRRNKPAFLADKVYQKLLSDGDPNADAVHTKLMDPANWYLPFKL